MIKIEKYKDREILEKLVTPSNDAYKYLSIIKYIYYIGDKKLDYEFNLFSFTSQLFELIDTLKHHYCRIEKVNKHKAFRIFVCERRKHQLGDIIIDDNSIKNKNKAKEDFVENSFNNFLNNAIANVISSLSKGKNSQLLSMWFLAGAFTCDQIFYKTEDDMCEAYHRLTNLTQSNNQSGYNQYNQFRLNYLGLYIRNSHKVGRIRNDIETYAREIWLCKPLIQEKYNTIFKEIYEDETYKNSYHEIGENDFFNKVFFHELGHASFDNSFFKSSSSKRDKSERRANYYASYISISKLDNIISIFTKKQPEHYHDPLLLSMKYKYIEDDKEILANEKDYIKKENELLKKENI